MRLFSWHGIAALAFAAGSGYVAGASNRTVTHEVQTLPSIPSREEEAVPPSRGLAFLGQRISVPEVIDLTCPPYVLLPFDLCAQTVEPPSAGTDGAVKQASFEVPAGPATPPFMPYLDE
jgi:hypothetical protein